MDCYRPARAWPGRASLCQRYDGSGVGTGCAFYPARQDWWSSSDDGHARGVECAALPCFCRLSVAIVAQVLSAGIDGPPLLLRLARCRSVRKHQHGTGHEPARDRFPGCGMCSPTAATPATNSRTRSPPWAPGPSRSSNARTPPKALCFCPAVGLSSAHLHGLADATGWPRTGKPLSPPQPHADPQNRKILLGLRNFRIGHLGRIPGEAPAFGRTNGSSEWQVAALNNPLQQGSFGGCWVACGAKSRVRN